MPKDRSWGFWTEQKLAMLADYLPAFTTASKKAPIADKAVVHNVDGLNSAALARRTR